MTVGKDHKMGFLREHLRVRESYSFVRLGSVWTLEGLRCFSIGLCTVMGTYLGWVYGLARTVCAWLSIYFRVFLAKDMRICPVSALNYPTEPWLRQWFKAPKA